MSIGRKSIGRRFAGRMSTGRRSSDEADYDDDEDMKMFAALFEASDENRDTGSGDAGSSGENSTAASSRVAPEVEGADGETGIGDAAPAEVGGPAGDTGIRGDAACSAPRSPVAGPPVAGPPAAGSGADQLSANDNGKGNTTDAKTAGQGKGKAATAPVGKPKAKPEAKPKAKATPKAQAKTGKPAKGNAGAKAKAKADAKKADTKSRAKHGTAGTFAGRRPPTNPMKRKVFDQMKASYLNLRLHGLSDEVLTGGAARPGKKARAQSVNQQAFIKHMQKRMAELAKAGVLGSERVRTASAEWQARGRPTQWVALSAASG